MGGDRAVHAVIEQKDDKGQLLLHPGDDFLPGHEKAAIAHQGDHGPVRARQLCTDRAGHAIAHGAEAGGELAMRGAKGEMAVQPAGEGARIVYDRGLVRQARAQLHDDFGHVDGAKALGGSVPARRGVGDMFLMVHKMVEIQCILCIV